MEDLMNLKTKEFGYLSTTQEQMMYMMIEEQRKTNELLASLVPKPEKKSKKSKEVNEDVSNES
jgi:hypothetical protein